ncbi:isochorismate synthase MenF [Brevibacterium aurantiacum]|uniref:isochorismate synthase n=1 Tax=Brevibacterium aurantiacum TaxID=273384 RepID=A0A556CAT9_BREAU|nr:isochorismate synthase [Brevibacterium aurantiacum]TSI14543.1 isochorismate synthase [Brevibacterium aurantiacum]
MSITPAERINHETDEVETTLSRSRPWGVQTERTARFVSQRIDAQVRGDIQQVPTADFEDAVETALANDPTADIVIGCLPFDPDDSAVFICGVDESALGAEQSDLRHTGSARIRSVIDVPDVAEYEQRVADVLRLIEEGTLEKVVLARSKLAAADAPIDPQLLLEQLRASSPHGFGFHIPLVDGGSFVGLSPELLVERDHLSVSSHPLAGSRIRTGHSGADEARIADLRASGKDAREHQLVVKAVAEGLAPYCSDIIVDDQDTTATDSMFHLGTWIRGSAAADESGHLPSASALARALHPTPAVCGAPTEQAREVLRRVEGDRGYFTGAVGWQDRDGNGEWAVAIRGAMIDGSTALVSAGAGIVAGSEPRSEAEETGAKLRTVLSALGLGEQVSR